MIVAHFLYYLHESQHLQRAWFAVYHGPIEQLICRVVDQGEFVVLVRTAPSMNEAHDRSLHRLQAHSVLLQKQL